MSPQLCDDVTVCCRIGNWATLTAQLKEVDRGSTEAASEGIGHSHWDFGKQAMTVYRWEAGRHRS